MNINTEALSALFAQRTEAYEAMLAAKIALEDAEEDLYSKAYKGEAEEERTARHAAMKILKRDALLRSVDYERIGMQIAHARELQEASRLDHKDENQARYERDHDLYAESCKRTEKAIEIMERQTSIMERLVEAVQARN